MITHYNKLLLKMNKLIRFFFFFKSAFLIPQCVSNSLQFFFFFFFKPVPFFPHPRFKRQNVCPLIVYQILQGLIIISAKLSEECCIIHQLSCSENFSYSAKADITTHIKLSTAVQCTYVINLMSTWVKCIGINISLQKYASSNGIYHINSNPLIQ